MSDKYKLSKIYRSLQHGETLVKELHTQFKEGRNCDLEIRLNRKRLYVHKCLIDTFFLKTGAELEDDRFYLDLSSYSQQVVEALIGLVYTGDLRCSLEEVENVYKAASELGFVEAQTGCMTYLQGKGTPHVLSELAQQEAVLPEPFPVEIPTDPDPNIVIKTEPVDDVEETVAEKFTQPTKKTDYRSTLLVPVANHSVGAESISSPKFGAEQQVLHYDLNSSINIRKFKTSSCDKVDTCSPYPSIPATKITKPLQKKTTVEYVYPNKSSNVKIPAVKGKCRPSKVACLEKTIVDKIKNLSEQSFDSDSDSNSRKSQPRNKTRSVVPEKHTTSAAAEELSSDSVSKSNSEKNNLIECKTKSGTVYYKYADPSSLSNDEFSIDSETTDINKSKNTTEEVYKKSKPAKPNSEKSWMEKVSIIVKTENVESDSSQGPNNAEEEKEAQKNEQMFSLGLTKTVDKSSLSNQDGNLSENPLKRKLRTRKKVDYLKESIERSSDLDEDSDYDPNTSKNRNEISKKRSKFSKGTSVKIESSIEDKIVNIDRNKKALGSKTIAVRQDLKNINDDDDDGYEQTAYFPPAGSVPEGVRSRYAQGKYMKVRYVTESIKDSSGNITVVTKPVPVRPRQFGMDERLLNRPAVYVCHPTAPVVKKVVR